MLGSARFSHIETCAAEVCKAFKQTEELQDCVAALAMLDETLAELRRKLSALKTIADSEPTQDPTRRSNTDESTKATQPHDGSTEAEVSLSQRKSGGSSEKSTPDLTPNAFNRTEPLNQLQQKTAYADLDIQKAKRLIQARENSIKAVRVLISKKESEKNTEYHS